MADEREAEDRQHEPPVEGQLGEWLANESAERVRHVRWVRRNVYRLYGGMVIFLLFAIVGLALGWLALSKRADDQRHGREVAIRVLCGTEQGVIDAGRGVLLKNGLKHEADRYALTVAHAIEDQAGVRGLLNVQTGKLRCDRIVRVSAAQ